MYHISDGFNLEEKKESLLDKILDSSRLPRKLQIRNILNQTFQS